jgi:hypothetical protein
MPARVVNTRRARLALLAVLCVALRLPEGTHRAVATLLGPCSTFGQGSACGREQRRGGSTGWLWSRTDAAGVVWIDLQRVVAAQARVRPICPQTGFGAGRGAAGMTELSQRMWGVHNHADCASVHWCMSYQGTELFKCGSRRPTHDWVECGRIQTPGGVDVHPSTALPEPCSLLTQTLAFKPWPSFDDLSAGRSL